MKMSFLLHFINALFQRLTKIPLKSQENVYLNKTPFSWQIFFSLLKPTTSLPFLLFPIKPVFADVTIIR